MMYFEFPINIPLQYNSTGKFQAPTQDWIHLTRILSNYELIIVTEGTAYIQIDQDQYSVNKGEFLLCSPSLKQLGYNKSYCAFYWLHFSCENTVSSIKSDIYPEEHNNGSIYIPTYGKPENLEKIIVMMKHLQDSVRSYNNTLQNNYLCTSIICEIYCQFSKKVNLEHSTIKKKQLYLDIQDYIKWNRNKDIKVSEIAQYFGYNKRYISYLFTTFAGVTLKQYIIQEKIEAAKFMLCDTNENISGIAYQLGFNDSHNFMKTFKKLVGLTPTQYRNAYASRLLFYK